MKIALVIGHYDALGGGAERWTDRFARWLLCHGHEVHLFARQFRDPPSSAKCHRIDSGPAWLPNKRLRFAREAEQLLSRQHFDVIHDMGDGWFADVFMPHHGTRIAGFYQNGHMLPAPLRESRRLLFYVLPRYREFAKLEARQYAAVPGKKFIALSKMVRDHMRAYYRTPESAIRIIYNGVDTDHFRPAEDDTSRAETRRELQFTDQTLFLIVAHNFRLKGLDTLLSALARLQTLQPAGVGLIVAGNGNIRRYRQIADRRGIGHLVRFVGNLAEPIRVYQAADVYVQPTFYDPCSLVALEALACGLPVITTVHNGVSELIGHGREGYILDNPLDDVTLTQFMRAYLDPAFRRCSATAARALAENHSLEANSNSILRLYEEIHASRNAA